MLKLLKQMLNIKINNVGGPDGRRQKMSWTKSQSPPVQGPEEEAGMAAGMENKGKKGTEKENDREESLLE